MYQAAARRGVVEQVRADAALVEHDLGHAGFDHAGQDDVCADPVDA